MSAIVLFIFLFSALSLWASVFGYIVVLVLLAPRRSPNTEKAAFPALPEIAVVIPTLNEDRFIGQKLENLRQASYPHDRMKITVVDGGSTDRTRSLVEEAIQRDPSIRLVVVAEAQSQTDQVNHALRTVTQEIVVVTDADARLDRSCIKELVNVLMEDPETAAVGAQVQPATTLLDERLHWRLVNYVWWLEGEALSYGAVSGVCYAVRRSAVERLTSEAGAKDILLTLGLCASGFRVRSCPSAHATELRAPKTLKDFIRFRRRRGRAYVAALRWSLKHHRSGGMRWLSRLVRWWHFVVTPKLTVVVAVLGSFLLGTDYLYWPIAACGIFGVSLMAGLFLVLMPPGEWHRPWRLVFASCRFLSLNLFSMMTLGHDSTGLPWKERE